MNDTDDAEPEQSDGLSPEAHAAGEAAKDADKRTEDEDSDENVSLFDHDE